MAPVDEIKEHLEKAESIIGHAAEISGRYREALKQDPRPLPERQEEVRQSLQVLGPPAWKVMFKVPETLPCDDCVQHGVSYVSAQRDAVNHKIGKPLHDPANVRRVQEEFCKIPVPSGAESLNTENAKGTGDTKMAFQLKGKTSQIVRLYVAGAVGGGVSFAIVDKYLIGPAAGLD